MTTSTTAADNIAHPGEADSPTQHHFPQQRNPPAAAAPYNSAQLEAIRASMPLLHRFATQGASVHGWSLIFRDHYVENSVAFLLATARAGIPVEWTLALAKGDRTSCREEVHVTLTRLGYHSAELDNAVIDGRRGYQSADEASATLAEVDAFIDRSHQAGRRVLVIDDGGLIAQGYGSASGRRVDAAIELTVSGVKRISAADVTIPVFNLARSQVKTHLGYLEIADSCLRRLHAIVPSGKFIGRPVLLLGYGTLGSRLAALLRFTGCVVSVVDTDTLALIAAAEAGFPTYRSVRLAIDATCPFLVVGTTGERAVTAEDVAQLADGTLLAPFATKDFSALTDPEATFPTETVAGMGRAITLPEGPTVTLLGDGRSLNLFEADAIPNQGYDGYRAGTLIAARALCADPARYPAGIHVTPADEVIAASGLFEAYYEQYLAPTPPHPPAKQACVIGYGVAGRLHTDILVGIPAHVTAVDPKLDGSGTAQRPAVRAIGDLPDGTEIDLWSVCSPTADHLPTLRQILHRDPAARILLEKPACGSHEIDELQALLAAHPRARLVVNDQYRHATALRALNRLIAQIEPGEPIHHIAVAFTKDRTTDIATGRFIDRNYGVLGYEWLHMLTVLRQLLPDDAFAGYLRSEVTDSDLWAVYDPRLFVASLTERSVVTVGGAHRVHVELASSIVGPLVAVGSPPTERAGWARNLRQDDDRHRYVAVRAGQTRFTVQLDPVTAPGGWQLDRNHHRLTAERGGTLLHEEVIEDSPLHTSIRTAVLDLLGTDDLSTPDVEPLRRIAFLAQLLHRQQQEAEAVPA